uniref:Iron hydrogenase large subunit C-terminal domain-containing protein n=1 Tax=Myotis lucifugus TaxID=59463 RepID=G1Q4F2_MYOLU
MKYDHCTWKECSKKTKTDDQENAAVNVWSLTQENREKGEFHKLANAKIFLSDSCVTADEGVQVSQQNVKDFFRVLNLYKKCDTSQHKVLAVSMCPQSLPYFAAKFSLSVTEASRRLCGFRKGLGVHAFDMKIASDFSILESQKEFVRWYCQHREEEPWLPMMTSTCPGSVHAERVLGHPITPHLCTAKFPQQIMGLVKDFFTRQQNLSPDKILYVIVSPCYDKKRGPLEDVPTALHISQGAECMLTSGEIVYIIEQSDLASNDAPMGTLFGDVKEEEVRLHEGASSDGYLAHIFRHTAKELFNEDVGVLTYRTLRNKDFQEVTLERDGEVLLCFEAAYGFRNIQKNVLGTRKINTPIHF